MSLSGNGVQAPATAFQPASGAGFAAAAKATRHQPGGRQRRPDGRRAARAVCAHRSGHAAPCQPDAGRATQPDKAGGRGGPSTLTRRLPSVTMAGPATPQGATAQDTPHAGHGAGAAQLASQNAQAMLAAVSRGGFAAPQPPAGGSGYGGPLSAGALQSRTAQLLSDPKFQSILKAISGGA